MSDEANRYLSGRGAQLNPTNRFSKNSYELGDDDLTPEDFEQKPTRFIDIYPKTIVNKVFSPDVRMDYSLNPYQGCEHGCTYCYARPTHEFWGYSAGTDFEQIIMVKKSAPELLRKTFEKKNWKVKPIILSGNTDCYQPCEKKFQLTRKLLKVFLEYRHPVGIITKNVLLSRDFDLIAELAKMNLIMVNISITTLDEALRRKLEPRTATANRKLALIEKLVAINVPVTVMASPIIPALNDHEILNIAKVAAESGAGNFHSHIVRLMGANAEIFENWLTHTFPDRKQKVMNQLKSLHGGKTGNSTFGERMKGQGIFARNIRQQGGIAKRMYFPDPKRIALRHDLFHRPNKNGQLDLFD